MHVFRAGFGNLLEPGRHIDTVAEDVVALDQDVAEIDADTKQHPLIGGCHGISLGHQPLDGGCACDGGDD